MPVRNGTGRSTEVLAVVFREAIIATAKRLLNELFYTLKYGWVFEDFPNFELKGCN